MNESFLQQAKCLILGTLIAYGLLTASHQGEFWPFSIYPMFSQAGDPWTRAVVRRIPEPLSGQQLWQPSSLDDLPGEPLALKSVGVNQNDVANFVSKTAVWEDHHLKGMRRLLDVSPGNEPLLVFRVRGRLEQNSVETTATPLILFATDTTFTAPSINLSISTDR